jgi:molybdenum cofactor cytidylyltransferase
MFEPCTLIVLAAGRGSRFAAGSHKLAAMLGEHTVLGTTLRHAIACDMPLVVVTTPPLLGLARESVAARDIVVVPEVGTDVGRGDPEPGMGRSIAAGVSATPRAAGWLVLPGDMPLVQPATIRAVARHLEHHAIAFAQHHGRRGHPVGFAAELYSELVELSGDEGARRLVARYPAKPVECDDPGILVDIDTVLDLELAQGGPAWKTSAADSAF